MSPILSVDQRDRSTLLERMRERGDVTLLDLLRKATTDDTLSAFGKAEITKLLGWIETLGREARTHDVGGVLLKLLELTGVLTVLGKAQDQQTIANLADLQQFYSVIDRFTAATDEPTLHAFLEYLDLALASGDEGTARFDPLDGPDAVQMLTVHSAKGLEFRYVFLAHLVDRRFPTSSRAEQLEFPKALQNGFGNELGDFHLMEERRLFYVGMTRARDGLFFTSAEDYGGVRKKKLSRFLFEAGIASLEAPPKPTGKTRFEREGIKNQSFGSAQDRELGIMGSGVSTRNGKLLITNYQLPVPDTFSYTQIKAYESCPLQYKFAHVLHLPRRGNFTLSFGQTMHKTLEKFFSLTREGEQGALFAAQPTCPAGRQATDNRQLTTDTSVRVPPLSMLLELYDRCWEPKWYDSARQMEEFRARGKSMLTALYERYEKNGWPAIWALEKPFLVTLGDIRLKGKIDRIDVVKKEGERDEVAIVDYKTGKSPKTDGDVDHDQLLVYQIAVSTVLGAEPVELRYEFLEDQKVVAFLGSTEQLAALEHRIAEVVDSIRAGKFSPTPGVNVCGFCDFKEICEYRVL